jgi:hypothetical protein
VKYRPDEPHNPGKKLGRLREKRVEDGGKPLAKIAFKRGPMPF